MGKKTKKLHHLTSKKIKFAQLMSKKTQLHPLNSMVNNT